MKMQSGNGHCQCRSFLSRATLGRRAVAPEQGRHDEAARIPRWLRCVSLLWPGSAAAQGGRAYQLGRLTPIARIAQTSPGGKILVRTLEKRGFLLSPNLAL